MGPRFLEDNAEFKLVFFDICLKFCHNLGLLESLYESWHIQKIKKKHLMVDLSKYMTLQTEVPWKPQATAMVCLINIPSS